MITDIHNSFNKMLIKIPHSFNKEKIYLIDTVFKEFLGLEFKIDINSKPEYEILLPNKNLIIIEDHFFSAFNDGLDYLKRENIPEKISYSQNPFTKEKNIPVIFGLPEVIVHDSIQKIIQCKIDIFGAIFFMLTRWEEYVITDKDEYGRFPEKLSLSIRNGINRRPVVNEYVEMLWNMFRFLGFSGERKKVGFEAVITHDVDQVSRYKNILKLFRILAGDILLRKKPGLIPISIKDYFNIKSGIKKDSYDTFDFLMDQSEKIKVKSHFYFLSQKNKTKTNSLSSNFDFRYDICDPKVISIIQNIQKRGHFIGIHGSYNSYNNPDLFSDELNQLKKIAGKITECRQHYLRFSPPVTWEIENRNNIKQDSTLGFNYEIGFRCGTCYSFPVFDFLKRESLELVELPLTVMEGAVIQIAENQEDFYLRICSLIDVVKKYEGKFVLLWHTNSFNVDEWYPYQKYYLKIIDYLGAISQSS